MSNYSVAIVLSSQDATYRKFFDWRRTSSNIPCTNPQITNYQVAPSATTVVFNGVRSLALDNTTQLTLTLSPIDPNRYRFTWTGGTNPVFRTDRALTCVGHTITMATIPNGTVSCTSSTVGDFTAVVVSDIVWIPGVTTGDTATVFDEINVGQWVVIGKDVTSTILYLQRPPEQAYQGLDEVVVLAANTQLQAFSVNGLLVGDTVDVLNGFTSSVHQAYEVVAATSQWFEVLATGPLPSYQVGVPTISGIQFYVSSKMMVYVEVDQDAFVKANGGTNDRVSPLNPGSTEGVGWYGKSGPIWSLEVTNRSSKFMNVTIISVE